MLNLLLGAAALSVLAFSQSGCRTFGRSPNLSSSDLDDLDSCNTYNKKVAFEVAKDDGLYEKCTKVSKSNVQKEAESKTGTFLFKPSLRCFCEVFQVFLPDGSFLGEVEAKGKAPRFNSLTLTNAINELKSEKGIK
ncbi:MAG: hypothetical protein JNK65_05660 [Deltaproteobacteria bacterium]|nr:hypothetical protein [Deltaproteobacteria bacterium]